MASKGDHRITPQHVVDAVAGWKPIALDPCWNPHALTTPGYAYDGGNLGNGLVCVWAAVRSGCVFANFPWSEPLPWARKALLEHARKSAPHILLWGPCYTEARWSRELYASASAVCFWGRRVHHPIPGETKRTGSMWPTQLVYLGPDRDGFAKHFRAHGTVMRPL